MNEAPTIDRAAWIGGYLNLYHRRYDASTAAPVMNERYRRLHDAALTRGRLYLVDFLAVGFVLSERPVPPFQPITSSRSVTVYANPARPPMATFWTRAKSFPTADAAVNAAMDARAAGALPVAGNFNARIASAEYSVAPVEALSLDSRQARVVLNAPSDGILMLTQQDAPAWRVTVDGKPSKKILAAGVFRAVELSAGRHEVVWTYRSNFFFVGLVMTIVTALSMQLSTFVKRSRSEKFSR